MYKPQHKTPNSYNLLIRLFIRKDIDLLNLQRIREQLARLRHQLLLLRHRRGDMGLYLYECGRGQRF